MDQTRLMMDRTPLRRLEIFCRIVDDGGVTRAAERMLVAQPAVSAQLRALEASFGTALVVRRGKALELTESGERVYAWARQVLAGSAQIQREVNDLAAGEAGSVVAYASMGVGSYLLPPILGRLARERPGCEITLHVTEPASAIRATEIGDADFAIATGFTDPQSSLTSGHLWDEPIVVCIAPDGPRLGEQTNLSELAALTFVGAPAGSAYDRIVNDQLEREGAPPLRVMLRVGHPEAAKTAIIDNGWACLLPRYVVADDVRRGRLRAVPIRDASLVDAIRLYHLPTRHFSALQQAVLDALRHLGPTH